jgi:hypothetical protein
MNCAFLSTPKIVWAKKHGRAGGHWETTFILLSSMALGTFVFTHWAEESNRKSRFCASHGV